MDTNFDSFLNFDQEDYTSASSSSDLKSTPLSHHSTSPSETFLLTSNQPQTFSGPSYPYDSHRQQTGLPVGGLANTFAVNQATGLHYRPGSNGFVLPTDTLNLPLNQFNDFDFNQPQSFDTSDMDFDVESPHDPHGMFYSAGGQNLSPQQPTQQRVYPGMHSKQAAQAKAKQEELRRQQESKQIPGQQALPTEMVKSSSSKDPHVEESISRLLNRMRHNSDATLVDGEDEATPPAGSSSASRIKKDEDDMDEDERLLASEEGKKLSSKERRQLRNKVSARAFRSRRKEYIGQLEGEVAVKVQEAEELRTQNRQLMEENKRLTDLTRMLLSSQSFSGFLQELSNSGGPPQSNNQVLPQQQQQTPQQQQQQLQAPQQTIRKDISAHDAARQVQNSGQQMQVGMTMVPETTFDMGMLENNSWNNMLPVNDFQVFSLTSLPEPPQIDLSAISGKSKATNTSSKDVPVLPALPLSQVNHSVAQNEEVDDSVELDAQQFDLYFDHPSSKEAVVDLDLPTSLFVTISKASVASELNELARVRTCEEASWDKLHKLCESLDDGCDQLARFIPNTK